MGGRFFGAVCVIFILIGGSYPVQAQLWEFHVDAGLSLGKLLPMKESTKRTDYIRYGFGQRDYFAGMALHFNTGEHTAITFGYQASESIMGIQFLPDGKRGQRTYSTDAISLHNFSVGYLYKRLVGKGRYFAGIRGQAGLAFGKMSMYGEGSGGGSEQQAGGSVTIDRTTGFEVIPDFWTPTATVGLFAGPNIEGRKLGDRLSLHVSATLVWKNPYIAYSKTDYELTTGYVVRSGTAQWQGRPLLLQIGINYQLFHFGERKFYY